jgi:hypothetical protein
VALTKETIIDKIEVVGTYKAVQVRTAVVVKEDDVELSRTHNRHVISAGSDYSSEDSEVQAVCQAVHTSAIVSAYTTYLEAQE